MPQRRTLLAGAAAAFTVPLAWSQAHPSKTVRRIGGKHSYASSDTGGIGHLQMELYENLSGTFVTHIQYRGAGPALTDVVAAPRRLAVLPDLPTCKEMGLEPVHRPACHGIAGPEGLPQEVVDKVHDAVRKTPDEPAVKKRIEDTGSTVIGNTPQQFALRIAAELEVYKKVVAAQKLRLE